MSAKLQVPQYRPEIKAILDKKLSKKDTRILMWQFITSRKWTKQEAQVLALETLSAINEVKN